MNLKSLKTILHQSWCRAYNERSLGLEASDNVIYLIDSNIWASINDSPYDIRRSPPSIDVHHLAQLITDEILTPLK